MTHTLNFRHENAAVQNYVNMLLEGHLSDRSPILPARRAQLIILAGISLNDTALLSYAADLDRGVVNRPISAASAQIHNQIFGPAFNNKYNINIHNPLSNNCADQTD
jgi:hypothetical protein